MPENHLSLRMDNSEQEIREQEAQALKKQWNENVCKFTLDLAKIIFAGLVIGGIVTIKFNRVQWESLFMIVLGIVSIFIFVYIAKRNLK
ncbi:hypothetical protein Barb6XT_00688 [Bacteroidales bacterium Barb6XT]|nr:hypothetical protein Barb6XT_00688 [Bacteroidales bacterium Barb6XT]